MFSYKRSAYVLTFFFLFLSTSVFAASPFDRVPTNVTVLTQKDFIGKPYFSVGDALVGVTSIKRERDGSRGTQTLVSMRGFSNSKSTLVLLDGRPLTHEYDSEVDLTQLPLTMIERIEINRSGGSVSYSAGGAGGTINIVTRRPQRKGVEVFLGAVNGRDGVRDIGGHLLGRSNLGDITYAAGNENSGGFARNENFTSNNHFGNVTRSFNGKGYWGVEYLYHEATVGLAQGTLVPFSEWNGNIEQASSNLTAQKDQESQHAKGLLAYPLLKGGTVYFDATHSVREYEDSDTPDGPATRDQKNTNDIFHLYWRKSSFEIGAQSQKLTRSLFGEPDRNETEKSVYILNRFEGHRWSLLPGIRLDDHSVSGDFVSPRIAFLYAPSNPILLSANAARVHRNPNFDELYFSSPALNNPNLDDEKSHTVDIGVGWKPTDGLDFKFTQFWVRTKDLIAADFNTDVLQNGGTENSSGFESEITYETGANSRYRHFILTGNWTVQKGRRSIPNRSSDVPAAMSPTNIAFGRWEYPLPRKVTLTNEIRYQSEQFELDNHQGLRIPGFYIWNFRLGLKILSADLFFQVENITRRRYAETFALVSTSGSTVLSPQPDRTFWVGASVRFDN